QDSLDGCADHRRTFDDVNAGLLHRSHFLGSGAFSPRNDRAGMTHATARGSGAARDKTDDRLRKMFLYIFCRFFLSGAANLADHDHRVRAFIVLEEFERIEKLRSDNRIAADPDAGRLSKSKFGDLPYGLVGECAATRNQPDPSRLV